MTLLHGAHGYGKIYALILLCVCVICLLQLPATYRFYSERHVVYDKVCQILGSQFGITPKSVTMQSDIQQLSESDVLSIIGVTSPTFPLCFDLKSARASLLALPLVQDAELRMNYEGKILVKLKKAVPFAYWQHNGIIYTIARDGKVIESVQFPTVTGRPFLLGAGANTKIDAFMKLFELAKRYGLSINYGVLKASGRWDLNVQGVIIRLPEREALSRIKSFFEDNKDEHYLSRALKVVDLRIPHLSTVKLFDSSHVSTP